MRRESVKFCLMIITHDGWCPALQGVHASSNAKDVREFDDIYQRIRPGYGKSYVTHITRIDENFLPLEQELAVLERYSIDLKKRAARLDFGVP
jgi:hypothetical protein